MRTREDMKVAKAKGRLHGKQPKLKPAQEAHPAELWRAGKHTSAELAELFSVARAPPSSGPCRGLACRSQRGLVERDQPLRQGPDPLRC